MFAVAVSAVLALPTIGQPPAHATWLNANSGYTDAVVRQLDDDVALCFLRPAVSFVGPYETRYSRSIDGGRSWLVADQPLTNFNPDDIRTDGGVVAVAGVRRGAGMVGGVTVATSRDLGSTWTTTQLTFTAAGGFGGEARAFVAGSTVCLFWTDPVNQRVLVARSTDGGQTWPNPPVVLGQVAPSASSLAMGVEVIADGSTAHVFYQTESAAGTQYWLQSSTDAGLTWLPSPRVVPWNGSATLPRMWGNAGLLFAISVNGSFSRSSDTGLTWTPVTALAAPFVGDVVVDRSFVAVLAYDFGSVAGSVAYAVQTSSDGGLTWSSPGMLLNAFGPFLPELRIAADDMFIAFKSLQPDESTIAHSADGGVNWTVFDDFAGIIGAARERVVHVGEVPGPFGTDGNLFGYVGVGYSKLAGGTLGSGAFEPRLGLSALSILGRTVTLDVANALGGTLGVVGVTSLPPVAVPLLGGTVWVPAPVLLPLATSGAAGAPGVGSGSVALALPASPSLVGASVTAQGLLLDPAATLGLALTDGIEIWLR